MQCCCSKVMMLFSTVHTAVQAGKYTAMKLGLNFGAGERPHFTVKGGSWFGSCLENRDASTAAGGGDSSTSSSDGSSSSSGAATPYVLAGCTVAPGFDFADFELPTRCVSCYVADTKLYQQLLLLLLLLQL
jgi:uncharacterized protein